MDQAAEGRELAEALLVHVIECGATCFHIDLEVNGTGPLDGQKFRISVQPVNDDAGTT
jgi:hypothetical protein